LLNLVNPFAWGRYATGTNPEDPAKSKVIETYISETKIPPIQYLIARAVGIIGHQRENPNAEKTNDYTYYPIQTRTDLLGLVSSASTVSGSTWLLTDIFKIWNIGYAIYDSASTGIHDYDINPSLFALYSLTKPKAVFVVPTMTNTDSLGDILNQLYKLSNIELLKLGLALGKKFTGQAIGTGTEVPCKLQYYINPVGIDKSQLLNFYMNPSKLYEGIKTFKSTYNKPLGTMLREYEEDRSNFLESRKWVGKK
jgi:hypothetical protein